MSLLEAVDTFGRYESGLELPTHGGSALDGAFCEAPILEKRQALILTAEFASNTLSSFVRKSRGGRYPQIRKLGTFRACGFTNCA